MPALRKTSASRTLLSCAWVTRTCKQYGAPQISCSYYYGWKWRNSSFEIATTCAFGWECHKGYPSQTSLRETNRKKAASEVWKCPQIVQLWNESQSRLCHGKAEKRNSVVLRNTGTLGRELPVLPLWEEVWKDWVLSWTTVGLVRKPAHGNSTFSMLMWFLINVMYSIHL